MATAFPIYPGCPVCGDPAINPVTLAVRWHWEPELRRVVGHFTPGRDHAGYAGRMHGGILSALLDECMAWACAVERRSFCVTGDLRIRFKSTARLGEEIEVTGVAETGWGHYLHASGEANSAGGAMLATATATFAALPRDESVELRKALRFEPGDLDVLLID